MKQMKDKCFIDTNILVYCYSTTEPVKKRKAIEVSRSENAIISTQVLKEFSNTLLKKFELDWVSIERTLDELTESFIIFINQPHTIKKACSIGSGYGYTFYDSLIIASALEAGCKILYTEDLQHMQLIDKKLQIINPFVS